jgi:hypothetical protein
MMDGFGGWWFSLFAVRGSVLGYRHILLLLVAFRR